MSWDIPERLKAGLQSCPFCGKTEYLVLDITGPEGPDRAVRCGVLNHTIIDTFGGCWIEGPEAITDDEAVSRWNTRPIDGNAAEEL